MAPSDVDEVSFRCRGRLPHIERQGAVYFVTFRLADSLPASLVGTLKRTPSLQAAHKSNREHAKRKAFEVALDKSMGACWLARSSVAEVVKSALAAFHGERYVLGPWCIMPNHVHGLLRPIGSHQLASILHSWKSFTAKQANRILLRRGAFWQREYYDHVVRSENELRRCAAYILANPARAGLEDWQWVGHGDVERLISP